MNPELFMVFDVESVGLHGEGFAVGYVVIDRDGKTLDEGVMACDPTLAGGTHESQLWVAENVPSLTYDCPNTAFLRNFFWTMRLHWKEQGAQLVADCAWPVEARFLAACVDLHHSAREWQGPYPLHDLASMLLVLGQDPLAARGRLANELPAHHPLMDARQSARLLVDALKGRAA